MYSIKYKVFPESAVIVPLNHSELLGDAMSLWYQHGLLASRPLALASPVGMSSAVIPGGGGATMRLLLVGAEWGLSCFLNANKHNPDDERQKKRGGG